MNPLDESEAPPAMIETIEATTARAERTSVSFRWT